MAYDLGDKVVFVTGASSGIGWACAEAYHAAGAKVVATARRLDRLEALVAGLGERAAAVPLDITDAGQRDQAFRRAKDRWGRIDVLVNNAGWSCLGTVLRVPDGDIQRMLAVNFTGPLALIRAVLPEMIQRGSGQIVNITSVGGHQAIPRMTVYSAAKAALESLSTGLRIELKKTGVDVITIAPHATESEFFEAAGSSDVRAGRITKAKHTAEEVARIIVRASQRRKTELVLTLQGRMVTWARRLSPRLADAAMYHVSKGVLPDLRVKRGSGPFI